MQDITWGGTIADADGDETPYYCMSDESGSCEVDLYNGCEGQASNWTVELNDSVQDVACSWVLAEGAETPDHEPSCELDDEGTFLSVDGNQ